MVPSLLGGVQVSQIELEVWIEDASGASVERKFRLTADGSESFLDALQAQEPALEPEPDWEEYPRASSHIRFRGASDATEYRQYVEINPTVTVAEVAFAADGEPFSLSSGGWGGDALWVETMLTLGEILLQGLTLHGAWSLARDGLSLTQAVRYKRERRLAEQWRDGDQGALALDLAQAIKARPVWYRRRFDHVFSLEGDAGTRLLKAAGYRRIDRNDGEVVWVESAGPDSLAYDYSLLTY